MAFVRPTRIRMGPPLQRVCCSPYLLCMETPSSPLSSRRSVAEWNSSAGLSCKYFWREPQGERSERRSCILCIWRRRRILIEEQRIHKHRRMEPPANLLVDARVSLRRLGLEWRYERRRCGCGPGASAIFAYLSPSVSIAHKVNKTDTAAPQGRRASKYPGRSKRSPLQ
jgi:hypothetical protein